MAASSTVEIAHNKGKLLDFNVIDPVLIKKCLQTFRCDPVQLLDTLKAHVGLFKLCESLSESLDHELTSSDLNEQVLQQPLRFFR